MVDNPNGLAGQLGLNASTSDFNKISFLVNQILGRVRTMQLVRVQAVTNSGGVSPVGFVDVFPLVNQIDGLGIMTPHGQLFNLPYTRIQGGTNAIILDPKVGDIGWAAFADRDISSVKAAKGQANPGSKRRFSFADGVYMGGILNGTPENYVQFADNGAINIVSTQPVTVNASDVVVHGSGSVSSDVNGFGTRTTFTGGSNFTVDNYVTGAVVSTNTHPWVPGDLPPP